MILVDNSRKPNRAAVCRRPIETYRGETPSNDPMDAGYAKWLPSNQPPFQPHKKLEGIKQTVEQNPHTLLVTALQTTVVCWLG